MSKRAPIISFSGPDGSGKSTVIECLVTRLEQAGEQPVVVRSRMGYSPGFERLKTIARRLFGKKIPQQGDAEGRAKLMRQSRVKTTWLVIACADLLLTYGLRYRLLASQGKTVVCDRFVWDAIIDCQIYYPESTWSETMIRRGHALLGVKPDLSYLLSVSLEVAWQRSASKEEPFPDPPEIRRARHTLYESLQADPDLRVLDAIRSPDMLVDEILEALPTR